MIDDVVRAWYFVREQRGLRVVFGPGRHATSGASRSSRMKRRTCRVRSRSTPKGSVSGVKPDIVEFRKSDSRGVIV
jgi:hypothetical protein